MLYLLLLLHFVGDFVCQFRWLANNKSHNQLALLLHGLIYGAVLTSGMYFMIPETIPLTIFILWAAFNIVAHIITDAITSKMTSFFYKRQWMYLFFVIIGLDQLIHACTLIMSCRVFFEKLVDSKWLLG
jgi:hypothetical protein